MRYISRTFLKGFAAVLPIALTVYFVYRLAISFEQMLKSFMLIGLPNDLLAFNGKNKSSEGTIA